MKPPERVTDEKRPKNIKNLKKSNLGSGVVSTTPSGIVEETARFKDRAHLLRALSAEGKIDQMLDLEAEMELRAHIWPFDSTHEYFDP